MYRNCDYFLRTNIKTFVLFCFSRHCTNCWRENSQHLNKKDIPMKNHIFNTTGGIIHNSSAHIPAMTLLPSMAPQQQIHTHHHHCNHHNTHPPTTANSTDPPPQQFRHCHLIPHILLQLHSTITTPLGHNHGNSQGTHTRDPQEKLLKEHQMGPFKGPTPSSFRDHPWHCPRGPSQKAYTGDTQGIT